MHMRLLLAMTAWLIGSASAAAAIVPGSTAEYAAGVASLDKAKFAGIYTMDPAQARPHYDAALNSFRAGCNKGDARACGAVAYAYGGFDFLPRPRGAARQAAADKAAALFDAYCRQQGDLSSACDEFARFVRDIRKSDADYALADRTNGLPAFWLRSGQIRANRCLADFAKVGHFTECQEAFKILDPKSPDTLSLRETLCGRDSETDCHALGRLSTSEKTKQAALAAQCNAGAAPACLGMVAAWYQATWSPNYMTETRVWADKACSRDSGTACGLLGQLLLTGKGGPIDNIRGAEAFSKACRLSTGKEKEQMCATDAKVRAAIAARASAPK